MNVTVTKRFEFDAAHRLMAHAGRCRNLHGHRYAVDVTLRRSDPSLMGEDGMVIDFGIVKARISEWFDQEWDHACVLDSRDPLLPVLEDMNLKVRPMEGPPTAERMAFEFLQEIAQRMVGYPVLVTTVRVYETPTAFAEVTA